jgi:hypothetical protein
MFYWVIFFKFEDKKLSENFSVEAEINKIGTSALRVADVLSKYDVVEGELLAGLEDLDLLIADVVWAGKIASKLIS